MKLLHTKKGTIIDPDSIKHHPIFTKFTSTDMKIGNKLLLYIFLSCDLSLDNPLLEVSYTNKDSEARLVALGSSTFNIEEEFGPKWNIMTIEAKDYYSKNLVTGVEKDILVYDKKMDQFMEMLSITHPVIEKNVNSYGHISYATNIEIINGVLRDIVTMIQAKASLMSMMVKGTIPKNLRGGLSPNIKGKLKVI